jgi:protein gp37
MITLNTIENLYTGKYWTQGVNLIEGCSLVNRACKNCWSYQMAQRLNINPELLNKFMWNGKIKINIKFLERLKKPNQIFAIWNDLFHEDVPDQFIIDTFDIMSLSNSIFLVCTKRVRRLRNIEKQLIPAKNIIVGTTCYSIDDTNQIYNLLNISLIKNFKFFISFEPFVGTAIADIELNSKPEFAIVGHEFGTNAEKSTFTHALKLIKKLKELEIPIFVKKLYINEEELKHGELPTELRFLFE